MKKMLLALIILSLTALRLHAETTSSAAKIQALHGEVKILENENAPGQSAQVGMKIQSSQIITTGDHSHCTLQLDDRNFFRIKQNAKIKIEKLWEEIQKPNGKVVKEVRLNLIDGEITSKLDKMPPESEFNVVGPVAIAGAVGTAFTVAVNAEKQRTTVTVLDHEVNVRSIEEGNKAVLLQKFQRVETAPWSQALFQAEGRGVLSEAILGKQFVREAEQNIRMQAFGDGATVEEAKLQSLHRLSKTILQLHTDGNMLLEEALTRDPELTKKFYDAISHARIIGSIQNPDGSYQVKSEITLEPLTQTLGRPLYGITQSIIPLTLLEYSSKFGAVARVTTQRAAQVEGYRNLAEIIYGTVVSSETTLEDFAVKNDHIRTVVHGVVKGAQVVNTQYFSDGSVIVQLEIRADVVPQNLSPITGDIFGRNCLSGPQLIEFGNFDDLRELQ